ncbi:ArsR/SmtB family transcription factor [Methylobacterium sp. WSM2598]|uniref:ArsR/SmtB family transcription factor n=1 Tax=Methylobacterium sp. WSM2598 TaxID=398261 RepID=UPI000371D8DF|nr:helix-turn-helix transcriptional regulator [Methylobacterium sp. WSM2598]
MVTTATIAQLGALIGDPARAAMMQALMDGRALTAGELAGVAGITPQTASGHLAQLTQAGLLAVARQGRHRYHRLAGPAVARLIEGLMQVAGEAAPGPPTGPRDARLRLARTCYDHIAGRLGVALAEALAAAGWIEIAEEAGLVTPTGLARLTALGVALPAPGRARGAPLCRPCLDWSERRPHLAGRLGAALCAHGLDQGWIRREAGSRALLITPEGRRGYREAFGVALP